jgi:hypothetical protein
VAAGLAAVVLLGATGLVTSTALWWEAERNLGLARQREQDLDAARRLTEQWGDQERTNFAWAQEAVDEMLSKVGEGLEDVPHATAARRQVLEKALALQQRFLAHRSDDPRVRLEVARAHRRMAHADLRRVADDSVKDFPDDWRAHCRSAGWLCRAASLAAHDRPFADETTAKAVGRLTAAYELARKADRVADFAAAVRANKELAPLRDHAGFQAILAELPPPSPIDTSRRPR